MNIVGPLANPARAGRQVVGVADLERASGSRRRVGRARDAMHALVVHGEPGMDEISPLGPTHVIEIVDGATKRVDDRSGRARLHEDRTRRTWPAATPAENARIIGEILERRRARRARARRSFSTRRAAVYVSGRVKSYGDGVAAATKAIDSGEAKSVLERLKVALLKALDGKGLARFTSSTSAARRRRCPESRCRSRGRRSASSSRSPAAAECVRPARGRTSSPSPSCRRSARSPSRRCRPRCLSLTTTKSPSRICSSIIELPRTRST